MFKYEPLAVRMEREGNDGWGIVVVGWNDQFTFPAGRIPEIGDVDIFKVWEESEDFPQIVARFEIAVGETDCSDLL